MSQCQGIVVSTCFEKMRTMINFSITVSHVSGLPYGSTAGEESSITSLFSAAVAAAVAVVVVPGVPFIDFRRANLKAAPQQVRWKSCHQVGRKAMAKAGGPSRACHRV